MNPDTHTCPATGCRRQLPYHMLACAAHWRRVPLAVQRQVYRTWAQGAMPNAEAYLAARQAAIDAMNGTNAGAGQAVRP